MIKFPAYISGVKTMADGSLRLQIDTQELQPSVMTDVFSLKKSPGILFFAEDERELSDDELKMLDEVSNALKDGKNSPSKTLRNEIFKYYTQWSARYPTDEDFKTFYERVIDQFIHTVRIWISS